MRALVLWIALHAYAIKFYFWIWTMRPRDLVILIIALLAAVALAFAILMERNERKSEVICWDKPQEQYAHELCEFKLRNARLGHPALTRLLIAYTPTR